MKEKEKKMDSNDSRNKKSEKRKKKKEEKRIQDKDEVTKLEIMENQIKKNDNDKRIFNIVLKELSIQNLETVDLVKFFVSRLWPKNSIKIQIS